MEYEKLTGIGQNLVQRVATQREFKVCKNACEDVSPLTENETLVMENIKEVLKKNFNNTREITITLDDRKPKRTVAAPNEDNLFVKAFWIMAILMLICSLVLITGMGVLMVEDGFNRFSAARRYRH